MEYELADEIIKYVRSIECSQLKYEKLAVLLELVIYNEKIVDILKKTPIIETDIPVCFNYQYMNFISNKPNFVLLQNPMEDLALSWLHSLYH